jgi:TonB-dependent receptor
MTKFLSILLGCLALASAYGQNKPATLYGTLRDGNSGEPLAFATIAIVGTNLGTVSTLDGAYRLNNIPIGKQKITFQYAGYKSQELELDFTAGEEKKYETTLLPDVVSMEEVVVTGQAVGQQAAINQQLNSNTIVNVVSKEKLQELPDQNAAEAVGRLAGVSIQRDAGEGQKVIVRGLSPRFNSITINGERLPSTDENDRSVDLSMISPDALAGIELFKALKPDMDGDAVGGTVNFSVRKADKGTRATARLLTGYNDIKQDWGQTRANLDLSGRLWNNKLGVVATGNFQNANRSSEFISAGYQFTGRDANGQPIQPIEDFTLGDRLETRIRYGGSLTLDYAFSPRHSILFSSNYGRTEREEIRLRRRYIPINSVQDYDIRDNRQNTSLYAGNLSGEHNLGKLVLSWRGSHGQSIQETPYSLAFRFRELAAINPDIVLNRGPEAAIPGFKNNLNQTTLYDTRFDLAEVNETNTTFQTDLRFNFKASKDLSGFLKMGGKYRRTYRDRDRNQTLLRPYLTAENPLISNPGIYVAAAGTGIAMANFMGSYRNPSFLNGAYDIMPGTAALRNSSTLPIGNSVNINTLNQLLGGTTLNTGDLLGYQGHLDMGRLVGFYQRFGSSYRLNQEVELEDYTGEENIAAGYLMGEFNYKKWLMLMGGIRYERTDQTYTSKTGAPRDEEEGGSGLAEFVDQEAAQGYGEWLPMLHVRIKPNDWFDVRGAMTRALARPNFFNLVPWERINTSASIIDRGTPDLKHTTIWNYDLFLSFYNKMGLFTIGGFAKQLDNIDYLGSSVVNEPGSPVKGFRLNAPRNAPVTSTVRGLELDAQINLRSLKGFINGLVFSGNLTLIRSETFFPLFKVETKFIPEPPFFVTEVTDTVRSGRIPGQASLIGNVALGYEKKGFSGRLSLIYQGDALSPGNPSIGSNNTGVGVIPELDFFDQESLRLDFTMTQKFGKKSQWGMVLNVNNILNTPEAAFLGTQALLTERELFGLTADLGITYKFKK